MPGPVTDGLLDRLDKFVTMMSLCPWSFGVSSPGREIA